jgi:hypothetical protein
MAKTGQRCSLIDNQRTANEDHNGITLQLHSENKKLQLARPNGRKAVNQQAVIHWCGRNVWQTYFGKHFGTVWKSGHLDVLQLGFGLLDTGPRGVCRCTPSGTEEDIPISSTTERIHELTGRRMER